MSILIRGMEMPKNCQECGLYIEGACYAKGYRDYRSIMDMSKPDDCPLIEIPTPHGRLIDADALIADLVKYQNMLDPESRENARVLSVKSYLTLARGEAIIEAED